MGSQLICTFKYRYISGTLLTPSNLLTATHPPLMTSLTFPFLLMILINPICPTKSSILPVSLTPNPYPVFLRVSTVERLQPPHAIW
jgi:hypothetical protein